MQEIYHVVQKVIPFFYKEMLKTKSKNENDKKYLIKGGFVTLNIVLPMSKNVIYTCPLKIIVPEINKF